MRQPGIFPAGKEAACLGKAKPNSKSEFPRIGFEAAVCSLSGFAVRQHRKQRCALVEPFDKIQFDD